MLFGCNGEREKEIHLQSIPLRSAPAQKAEKVYTLLEPLARYRPADLILDYTSTGGWQGKVSVNIVHIHAHTTIFISDF